VDTAPPDQQHKRRQWLTIGVTAVAVAGVLVAGLASTNRAPAAGPSLAVAAHKATTTAPPTTAPVIAQPPGPKSATTAAAILYRLKQLLPSGQTSGYAQDGSLFGQIYLDRGHGPGMLRLDISRVGASRSSECMATRGDLTVECRKLPDGAQVIITRIPDNCIQSLVVNVDHGNGVNVQLNVSTCLAWNGAKNPAGPAALTVDEAVAIAADPSWGTSMDSALVAAAQQAFPQLPSFS
jgi:hypothetical protein